MHTARRADVVRAFVPSCENKGLPKAKHCRPISSRSPRALSTKHPYKRSVALRITTEAIPDAQTDDSSETFNWFKHWWPVQLIYNLDTDRPNRIQLLGEYFAVWKSKSGEWVAMKDMCPHRLAPLSEGRIEEDGTLMCSYHGWRFDESGQCVKIPQADDEKSHSAACNSSRSCAKTYPCKEFARVLWIWPDEHSSEEAQQTSLPIPDDHAAAIERSAKASLNPGYARDAPYGFNTLMENVVDPSHFPFSHHGTFFGTREMAKPLKMKPAGSLFSSSIASVAYTPHSSDEESRLEVVTPNCVMYQSGQFSQAKTWSRSFNFMTPIDANKTRFMVLQVSSSNFYGKPKIPFFLRLLMQFPWVFHLTALPILDGDNVFLHIQDLHVRSTGNDWNPKMYFMPTSADTAVTQYRQWLQNKGGGGPQMNQVGHEMTRRELLDRYTSHVAFCKICQEGLRFLNRVIAVCQAVATIGLIGAIGLLARSLQGSLAPWKAAASFVPFFIAVLVRKQIKEKIIPQFYFVDYVHADKN